MSDADDEFMRVVRKIVSTRSDTYWKHNGVVHLLGRAPDGKTECGLQTNFAELYSLRPDDPKHVTCAECDSLAPPPN